MKSRTCPMCSLEKPIEFFYRGGNWRGRINKRCSQCIFEARNPSDIERRCTRCKIIYPADHFWNEARCKFCRLAGNKKNRTRKHDYVDKIKETTPCTDCDIMYHPVVMHFDHLPQYEKIDNIGDMIVANVPLEIIIAEIAKCEVVCANCHSMRTHLRRLNT